MRWQKTTRLVIAVAAVAFAIVLAVLLNPTRLIEARILCSANVVLAYDATVSNVIPPLDDLLHVRVEIEGNGPCLNTRESLTQRSVKTSTVQIAIQGSCQQYEHLPIKVLLHCGRNPVKEFTHCLRTRLQNQV